MNSIEPVVGFGPRRKEKGTPRARAVRFGAVLTVLFGALGAWKVFRGGSPEVGSGLIALGVALLVYSVVHPRGALALRRGFVYVGERLGRINSVILLTVVYFVLVTPLGVLMRVLSRRGTAGGSYFVPRSEQRDAKHFERPY